MHFTSELKPAEPCLQKQGTSALSRAYPKRSLNENFSTLLQFWLSFICKNKNCWHVSRAKSILRAPVTSDTRSHPLFLIIPHAMTNSIFEGKTKCIPPLQWGLTRKFCEKLTFTTQSLPLSAFPAVPGFWPAALYWSIVRLKDGERVKTKEEKILFAYDTIFLLIQFPKILVFPYNSNAPKHSLANPFPFC